MTCRPHVYACQPSSLDPPAAARRLIPKLLSSLGFCVATAPNARAANLSGVSLLVSLVRTHAVRTSTARLQLPVNTTWLQILPFAPGDDDNGRMTSERGMPLIHHGPRLHAFCVPPLRNGSGGGGNGYGGVTEHSKHVLPEHLLRTLLRAAKAGLLPNEWPGATFLGELTPAGLGMRDGSHSDPGTL